MSRSHAALEHFRRAVAALDRADGRTAGRELDAVLRIVPDNAEARCLRGAAANLVGDHERARKELARGVPLLGGIDGETRDMYNEYGLALRSCERLDESEAVLRAVVEAQPDYWVAWHNLALTLDAADRIDEAIAAARRAVALFPASAGFQLLLGKLLRRQGRLMPAIAAMRRAEALEPNDPTILSNLGNTLFYLGEIDEALAKLARVTEILPDFPNAFTNLGTLLAASGRHADALVAHDRAYELSGGSPEAMVRRAATLLNLGRLAEGWHGYDARLAEEPRAQRWLGTPVWRGESLEGQTLLVYREQGIGDEIMFASCYRDLAAAAHHLCIEADPRIEALVARSFPGVTVRAQTDAGTTPDDVDAPRPIHPEADVAVASGSVAQYIRTRIEDYPRYDSYLRADPATVAEFRERLAAAGPGPYVGVSWRSMIRTAERRLEYTRLDEWGPILRNEGVTFVLLQYDQCEREVAAANARFGVEIHRWRDLDLMNDLDRVAALMTALDLVIAPRNAVTMLGGAIGTPTLAIGNIGDWSECGTGQLPWFTSVECVNRNVGDPWDPVIATVGARVAQLAAQPGTQVVNRKALV